MKLLGFCTILTLVALLTGAATPVLAINWTNQGGTAERQNWVQEEVQVFSADRNEWQRVDLRPSATQPLVIGQMVYHLTRDGLHEIDLSESPLAARPPVVRARTRRITASSPVYSKVSHRIYWGEWGTVFSYDTITGTVLWDQVASDACEIVSSPLILYDTNLDRELVVVGHKSGGGCSESRNISAIWGLDGLGQIGHDSTEIGGWATPSPVALQTDPLSFVMGADGIGVAKCNGRVYKVKAIPLDNGKYYLEHGGWAAEPDCSVRGVAAGFAAAERVFFWVDVTGHLFARTMDGKLPPGWTADGIDLAAKAGGGGAFSNTTPALFKQEDGWQIAVTLRNHDYGGSAASCEGAGGSCRSHPGSIVVLDLGQDFHPLTDPTKKSVKDLGTYDSYGFSASNTNPLILAAGGTVIWGDTNGKVHWHPLVDRAQDHSPLLSNQTNPWVDLMREPTFGKRPLADEGRSPMKGATDYSQVSGAGVEPVIASGSGEYGTWFLMGVNTIQPGGDDLGSLFAIPVRPGLDLAVDAISAPSATECGKGDSVTFSSRIINSSDKPVETTLVERFERGGQTVSENRQTVTLQPGPNILQHSVMIQACGVPYNLSVRINPEPTELQETDYTNNEKMVVMRVNIALRPTIPGELWGLPALHVMIPADCIIKAEAFALAPCANYPAFEIRYRDLLERYPDLLQEFPEILEKYPELQ